MARYVVWGCSSRNGSGIGQELAGYLSGLGHEVVGVGRNWNGSSLDLHKEVSINMPVSKAECFDKIGHVDAVILTSGYGFPSWIFSSDTDIIDNTINANLRLPMHVLSGCLPVSKHFIFTTSIAGVIHEQGNSVYAATKGGTEIFAKIARRELPGYTIQTLAFRNASLYSDGAICDKYMELLESNDSGSYVLDV